MSKALKYGIFGAGRMGRTCVIALNIVALQRHGSVGSARRRPSVV